MYDVLLIYRSSPTIKFLAFNKSCQKWQYWHQRIFQLQKKNCLQCVCVKRGYDQKNDGCSNCSHENENTRASITKSIYPYKMHIVFYRINGFLPKSNYCELSWCNNFRRLTSWITADQSLKFKSAIKNYLLTFRRALKTVKNIIVF